ncbi:helicase [Perkinsela sp. CCAP 1560/4]|nr:helicase [Perkinsela sp. CCAP 1560/4]|eukprot:KNH06308.1 helicase [Perkinsela sp. CCAP 1560/4]
MWPTWCDAGDSQCQCATTLKESQGWFFSSFVSRQKGKSSIDKSVIETVNVPTILMGKHTTWAYRLHHFCLLQCPGLGECFHTVFRNDLDVKLWVLDHNSLLHLAYAFFEQIHALQAAHVCVVEAVEDSHGEGCAIPVAAVWDLAERAEIVQIVQLGIPCRV